MSAGASQLSFAAEFTLFLATVAGVAVMAVRADLLAGALRARVLLAVGFIALGAAAFAHGSLLADDGDPVVVALRVAGIALVLAGTFVGGADRLARLRLWAGVALLGVAEGSAVAAVASGDDLGALVSVARGLGAIGLGLALLGATRRSIPARVAASAAGTVLVVVLAVSVTLSAVVVDNVEDEALNRVAGRATAEAELIDQQQDAALRNARNTRAILGISRDPAVVDRLVTLVTEPASPAATVAAASIEGDLRTTRDSILFAGGRLAFVPAVGPAVVDPSTADESLRLEIGGNAIVRAALDQRAEAVAPAVLGGRAVAVAVVPVTLDRPTGPFFAGVVVASEPLDDEYLEGRAGVDEAVRLSIADREVVYSGSPGAVEEATATAAAAEVLAGGATATSIRGGRFVAAAPILAGERPVLALVASAPTTLVDGTRESLFRTLFLVALGAALLAIVLAALVGERIGAGLRRLTATAEQIRAGDLSAEASLDREDELGVLGTAFDEMSGSLRSMTDELRGAAAEEARLRGRLEAVVAGMGEALMAVDANGRVTDFNAAAEELFEVAAPAIRGEAVGRLALVGPKGEDLTDLLRTPRLEAWSTTATIVQHDGTEVPVAASGGAVRGPEGEVAGGVVVLRDMRRERAVERMRTEFLSNISHELKTPLTPIKGYAGIMVNRKLTVPQARRFAEDILVGAAQLERVIGQLVNFATVASGQLELRTEASAVRPLLEGIEQRWVTRLPASHSLVVRVGRDTPAAVVDRRYLELAVDELVDNARKYSPEGGVITLAARPSLDGDHVELLVTDRGVGIEPGAMDGIFSQFSQGDGSTTRAFGGLGLGLSFVQHVVDAHGGELSVTSDPGRGTEVTVTLPAGSVEVGAGPRKARVASVRARTRRPSATERRA